MSSSLNLRACATHLPLLLLAGALFHRQLDNVVFMVFAGSYGLAGLCWLAVDVTKPLEPKAE